MVLRAWNIDPIGAGGSRIVVPLDTARGPRLAVKLAWQPEGWDNNAREVVIWIGADRERRRLLCPPLLLAGGGAVLVAQRGDPVAPVHLPGHPILTPLVWGDPRLPATRAAERQYGDEIRGIWRSFGRSDWRSAQMRANNHGLLDGRLVALDVAGVRPGRLAHPDDAERIARLREASRRPLLVDS